MDVLFVDFSYDDNVKRSTRRIARRLSDRKNDYSGVKARLSSIQSNTGNITDANMYLEKKMRRLEEKRDKLTAFGKALDAFDDNARETDKRVAKRLEKQIKSFCKREGIPGVFQTMLTQGGKQLLITASKIGLLGPIPLVVAYWDKLKAFYEKNKYWIDIAMDVFWIACGVAALILAPELSIGLVPIIWGIAKSTVELKYDIDARNAYLAGDTESAEALRKMGMEECMQGMLGDEAGTWVYRGLEVVSIVCGFAQFSKDFKILKRDMKTCDNMLKYGSKQLATRSKVKDYQSYRLFKMTTGLDFRKVTAKNIIKNSSTITKMTSGVLNGKSVVETMLSLKVFSSFGADKLYSWHLKPLFA